MSECDRVCHIYTALLQRDTYFENRLSIHHAQHWRAVATTGLFFTERNRVDATAVTCRFKNESSFERVMHHRGGIPIRTNHWPRNLVENIVTSPGFVPEVRGSSQALDHSRFIPSDPGFWVLVFVREPQRVADFVHTRRYSLEIHDGCFQRLAARLTIS